MEYQKDYSLLRPFDLEAAKRGDRVSYADLSGDITYLAGPDPKGTIAYQSKEMVYTAHTGVFRMAPLAWVEGRPVYCGDVLYYEGNRTKILGKCNQEDDSLGILLQCASYGAMLANLFSWQKPKTKRKGWMNCYSDGNNYVYPIKEVADRNAVRHRTSCIEIEWEE